MAFPETLEKLIEDGVIDGVRSRLMSGKEASVFVVERQGELLAAKVYKAREQRTFKATASYTEGRNQTRNTRDKRAMGKRSSYGKELIEENWRDVEARVLSEAFHAGVRVPKPFMLHDDVLLMELVVDEEGNPAPRLADFELPREVAERLHREIYDQVRLLLAVGKVHGDLSAFNILMARGGPTLIDMPQVVDAAFNNQAREILRRDLRNVTEHLARFDARLLRFRDCGDALWMHYVNGTLETATEPQEGGVSGGHHRSRRGRDAERGRMGRERPDTSTLRGEGPARGPVGHGPGTPSQAPPRQGPPRDAPPRPGQSGSGPRGDGPQRQGSPGQGAPRGDGPPRDGSQRQGPPRDGQQRQDAPRDGQQRQGSPRDGQYRQDAPRDGQQRQSSPRDGQQRQDSPRDGQQHQDSPRDGQQRQDSPRDGQQRQDSPRDGQQRQDSPRDGQRQDSPRDAQRQGPPRDGQQRQEPPRDSYPRRDASRDGQPRQEPPRDARPRQDAPRPGAPGQGTPRSEGPPREGTPRQDGPRPGSDGFVPPRNGPPREGGQRGAGYGPRDGGPRPGGSGYGPPREGGPRR